MLDDRAMNARARRGDARRSASTSPSTFRSSGCRSPSGSSRRSRARWPFPHRIVIFDEPTASLTPVETDALLKLIRELKAKGVAVLYISHRLEEVKAIADVVTVLRDGKQVATAPGRRTRSRSTWRG